MFKGEGITREYGAERRRGMRGPKNPRVGFIGLQKFCYHQMRSPESESFHQNDIH